MQTLTTVIHITSAILIVLVVLLQAGKSGGMAFGAASNSQSVFGASGAGNFLTKLTTIFAFIFMMTSLGLTCQQAQRSGSSVMNVNVGTTPPPPPTTLPETPTNTTPPAPSAPPSK